MGLEKDLVRQWNERLCEDNLGLIESSNRIFPETIVMNYRMIQLRDKAREWVNSFDDSKLETIRYGELRGTPNFMHRRVIELFSEGNSTRDISKQLGKFNIKIEFQGIARIINRYVGPNNGDDKVSK